MLRRLEKRILVGLPSSPARQAMISHWMPPVSSTEGGVKLHTELDYQTLAKVSNITQIVCYWVVKQRGTGEIEIAYRHRPNKIHQKSASAMEKLVLVDLYY